MFYFRINGRTEVDRHKMIDCLKSLVSEQGGWITDFKMFSNISICLNVSGEIAKLQGLMERMETLEGFLMTEVNTKDLEETKKRLMEYILLKGIDAVEKEEGVGTIQITFIHQEKDLRIEIPKVPG